MKKILAILTIGILILTGGCSGIVAPEEASSAESAQSVSESSEPENAREGSRDAQSPTPSFRGGDNQNEVLGKITAISENEITIAIGTMSRPEGMQGERRTPPAEGESRTEGGQQRQAPPDGASRPEGGPSRGDSIPQGERPTQGERGTPGGENFGSGFSEGSMDLEYSGEEVSYVLADYVEITKGMGENSEDLTISGLKESDIVRLTLDEAEQAVLIQVFVASE